VDQRRYFVITPSSTQLGPFTREELRAALEDGLIDRQDQVRSTVGKDLGAVSALLRMSSVREPQIAGFLRRQPRSTVITLIALAVILVGLVGMFIALRATTVPLPPPATGERTAPEAGALAPDPAPLRASPAAAVPAPIPAAPDAPGAPAAGGAVPPQLGVQRGTVTSLLARKDPIIALTATRTGGANLQLAILNREVADNVLDGSVDSKYFNGTRDGTRPSGVNTGFAVTPRAAGAVSAFQIATANDAEGRDPLAITIEGSDAENAGQDQGNGFVLIYEGPTGLDADPGRKHWGACVVFANRTAYRTYRVLVSRTRDGNANGTQYSEFRLGTFTPGGSGAAR
jgi:hypothetical protein